VKPAPFAYHDPTSLDEALDLMFQFGEQARPLAGGQSLVPLMNFRLIRPAHLIDLNRIGELNYAKAEHSVLRLGATARQRQLERSPEVAGRWPLLRDAAGFIGHIQNRNRGTVGGSLAHAFPAAELPVAMVTLDAAMMLRTKGKERLVRAEEFFLGYMTTALEPTELLTEINVPPLSVNAGWAYQEVSRRHGDFALAGAAAVIALDSAGAIRHARLTLTGTVPFRARQIEGWLLGHKPAAVLFKEAARRATENIEQESDIHASAEYRREACQALAGRALVQAAARAVTLKGERGL
jgi:CO/xanthine dehydrogenase FAD-binding subunit